MSVHTKQASKLLFLFLINLFCFIFCLLDFFFTGYLRLPLSVMELAL